VGKKVQELTADLGVVGIVEVKLGGGGSTKDSRRGEVPRAAAVFQRSECKKAKGNWLGSFGVEMWC
jgi:hypothetical protein